MADDTLKGTLTNTLATPTIPTGLQVPKTTNNANKDIGNLRGAQKDPSMLMDFQKAMQLTSQTAYNERQTAEMKIAGTQFDPTKVSGGTFAGIIGNMESKRGADISKIHQSTMQTYSDVQNMVTQRLQFVQQQEANRKEFEATMEAKEKDLKRMEKNDDRDYAMAKEKFEMEKEKFEISKSKTGSDSADEYNNAVLSEFSSIPRGEKDGYVDTNTMVSVLSKAGPEAETMEEITAYKKLKAHGIDLMNPDDAEGLKLLEDDRRI